MSADPNFRYETLPTPSVSADVLHLPGINLRDEHFKFEQRLSGARRIVASMVTTGETYDLTTFQASVRTTIIGPMHAMEIAIGQPLTDTSDFDVKMPGETSA